VKPSLKPTRPEFSSGPCVKRPGWTPDALAGALLGRSHRTPAAVERIQAVLDTSRELLCMPADYRLALVPGSDTGAFECALWSLLGSRGVDVLAWESFGRGWATDVEKQLAIPGARTLEADYGELPDLGAVDFARDVVFTWNGTTSGVCVPDADWIPNDREGLTLCDATSAVFAMELDWSKLDVVTWSWQKALGGEGAHGMLALSPRAVERLEAEPPPRGLPKIFRLTSKGRLAEGPFRGQTINTPSMLCVEDALDALNWAKGIGGHSELVARSRRNLEAVAGWVKDSPWVRFLARDPRTRSSTSICLAFEEAGEDAAGRAKAMPARLAEEGAAYDVGPYRDAPPGLRIWGGSTVETTDIEALLPWLDWAYEETAPD
jgi:phosphoserine aminotransferase